MNKPVKCGCGGEPRVIMLIPEVYAVECSKCWIRTGSPARTEAEAITIWNKAMGADTNSVVSVFSSEVRDFRTTERTAKVKYIVHTHGYPDEGLCGNCSEDVNGLYDYCPYCGAKLEWE